MFKGRNKLLMGLLFLAAFSFIFFSVGDELLHSRIHHHHTQASHDSCFIYQLQSQIPILLFAAVIALSLKILYSCPNIYQIIFHSPQRNSSNPRAPPSVLS